MDIEQQKRNYDYALTLINVNTETGKLTWKVERKGGAHAGDEVGNIMNHGRGTKQRGTVLRAEGKRIFILSSRLVYYFHHKEIPEMVDHIDGNPLNNRKENLRAATASQNAKNRVHLAINTRHGFHGIRKYVSKVGKPDRWRASIKNNKKSMSLGTFDSKQEAVDVRRAAELRYYKEFAPMRP